MSLLIDWSKATNPILHPKIGVPADDTQGIPFITQVNEYGNSQNIQNYGICVKAWYDETEISGYLFTGEERYNLGASGPVDITATNATAQFSFVCNGINGYFLTTTANNVIFGKLSALNDTLLLQGTAYKQLGTIAGSSQVGCLFTYGGIPYMGMGTPVDFVDNYVVANLQSQTLTFYGGTDVNPNIVGGPTMYGGQLRNVGPPQFPNSAYGPVPAAQLPTFTPPFLVTYPVLACNFSTSETSFFFYNDPNTGILMAYSGVGNVANYSNYIDFPVAFYQGGIIGFDGKYVLQLGSNTISVSGKLFYPVYLYDIVIKQKVLPEYTRPVKNYTVNGHLNWRKR